MTDITTDRDVLTTRAYGSDANLEARRSIYAFLVPPDDLHEWALDLVPWRGDERVLDVGCGNGPCLSRLRHRSPGLRLLGIDISPGMLRVARRAVDPPPPVAVADVQDLPAPDHGFDVVVVAHMLYHVPDIPRALRELRRVLRPGGVLVVTTNALDHLLELDALLREVTGDGSDPLVRVSQRFSLENGGTLLRDAFDEVERRDRPGRLVVTEVQPLVAYLESTRSFREPMVPEGTSWSALMEAAEGRLVEEIARHGAFEIRTHAGAFVCR